MTPWLLGGLIAGLSFGFQVRPRLAQPLFGIDVWRHFLIAKYLRTHRRLPREGELRNHVFVEGTDYPPLLRVLLALCPLSWWPRVQQMFAPAIDAGHSLTLFAVTWGLSGDPWFAALTQLAYLVNPLVVMETSNLSTRSLSSLLFTWSVVPLLAYAQTGRLAWGGLAVVMAGLLLLSHRLAVQALVVLLFLMTWVDRRAVYLATLGGGVLVALLISQGFYLKVLRGHWLMLRYWRRNSAYRFAHQLRGLAAGAHQTKDLVHEVYQRLARLPAAAVVAGLPTAWFAAVAAVLWWHGPLHAQTALPPAVVRYALVWALGLVGAGMAIRQLPALRFLGEGERYGEYAAFPAAVLAATVVRWGLGTAAWGWWLAAALLIAIGGGVVPALCLQRKIVMEDRERSVTPDHQRIYEAVRHLQHEGPIRVASIPLGLVDALTYFTDCPVLATDSALAHWRYYGEFTPVLRRPLGDILARFGMTHLLVDRSYAGVEELRLTTAHPIAESGPLVLLDVRPRGVSHEILATASASPTAHAR